MRYELGRFERIFGYFGNTHTITLTPSSFDGEASWLIHGVDGQPATAEGIQAAVRYNDGLPTIGWNFRPESDPLGDDRRGTLYVNKAAMAQVEF